MSIQLILFLLLLSTTLGFFTLKNLIPFLRKTFPDNPNSRSSHKECIARGGGIVFVAYGVTFSLFMGSVLQLLCLPLALVGFIDDKYNISSRLRFLVQSLTILFLLKISNLLFIVESDNLSKIIFIFIFLIGLTIVNFINFMDGIDGIVAGCMVIIFSTIAYQFNPSIWPLVGALIGFIFLNWHPAKVFMGDVGSTFLGALYFGCLIQLKTWEEFLGILLLATPLIGDAFICLLRRTFNNEPIFKAHSSHLYQRLFKAGLKHDQVSIIYIFATLLLSLGWIFGGLKYVIILVLLEIIAGLLLDYKVAIPFKE